MFNISAYEHENRLELMSAIKERILKPSTTNLELGGLIHQWEMQLTQLKSANNATRVLINGREFDFEAERRRITELNANHPL